MSLTTPSAKAQRAQENKAYVRRLLWKHQPAFAAALEAAEGDLQSGCLATKQAWCRRLLSRPVDRGIG